MVSPLGYITPYTRPDFSGLHQALQGVRQMRLAKAEMAQQQAQFEADQQRRREADVLGSELGMLKLGQGAASAEMAETGRNQRAANRLAFDREKQQDAILKDFAGVAAEGSLPGLEGIGPRMRRGGLSLAPETQQPAPVMPYLPGMLLAEPKLGQSATQATTETEPPPLNIPGMLRLPQPMLGQSAQSSPPSVMPEEQRKLNTPLPQEAPLQAPERPTGRVRVMSGQQDLGAYDLARVLEGNRQAAVDSAHAWDTNPQDGPAIAAAQERMARALMAGGMDREPALKMALDAAEKQRNRIAAGQRASTMAGQRETTADRLQQKDFYGVYRDHLKRTADENKLRDVNNGLEAAKQLQSLARSSNPAAQVAAIGRTLKTMTTGAISDYENRFFLSSQSLLEEWEANARKIVGNPGQSRAFMERVAQLADEAVSRFEERKLAAAQDAYNAVASDYFLPENVRGQLAEQAARDILALAKQGPAPKASSSAPASGAPAERTPQGGTPSSAYTMPDGSAPPNLGVTSGKPPKVSDVNAIADDLLR